jgi:hypothetical protein
VNLARLKVTGLPDVRTPRGSGAPATGYNDRVQGGDEPTYRASVAAAVDLAIERSPDARLVGLGPWTPAVQPNANHTRVAQIISDVAIERGATYLDTSPWFANIQIGGDRVHPTKAGHAALGAAVAASLRTAGIASAE